VRFTRSCSCLSRYNAKASTAAAEMAHASHKTVNAPYRSRRDLATGG
jgi:hypothetical protein